MTVRAVFLGSPEFAVAPLRALVDDDRIDVSLVVSQPDRRAGRGRKLTPPPVAAYSSEAGLDLYQPHSLREPDALDPIVAARPDVLVVVAYGEILNRQALAIAPHGALNVHPSLLPRYRGASPIATAILNGDPTTGVSIMQLVLKLDAGPVLVQREVDIHPDDTTGSLGERLSDLSAEMLPDAVVDRVSGQIEATPQEDDLATYCREWTKADGRIDWSRPAVEIERLVRAALPWPVAWTELDGIRVQIREVKVGTAAVPVNAEPGDVFEVDGVPHVVTGGGTLKLVTVQPASKRAMPAPDWFRNLAGTPVRLQ